MPTPKTPTRERQTRHFENVEIRVEEDELPPGIIGRIVALALPFNQVDSYRSMFAPGCAARSIAQKVAARKVPFLLDHERKTHSHTGTVRKVEDGGVGYISSADILDTRVGRDTMEYAKALIASGGTTGVSIGFIPRQSRFDKVGEVTIEVFTEIELTEISLTPMPAVPGASVISARKDRTAPDEGDEEGKGGDAPEGEDPPPPPPPVDERRDDVTILTIAAEAALAALPDEARSAVLKKYAASPAPSAPAAPDSGSTGKASADGTRTDAGLSMDERLKLYRETFRPTPRST